MMFKHISSRTLTFISACAQHSDFDKDVTSEATEDEATDALSAGRRRMRDALQVLFSFN